VKGNPKGLMRAVRDGKVDDTGKVNWFFTTTIGKHTYATEFVNDGLGLEKYADFSKEGAFGKWSKEPNRRYFIIWFAVYKDQLILDGGDDDVMENLMLAEKIEKVETGIPYYKTPPGWLAKYLERNGPEKLYHENNRKLFNEREYWSRP
jgi:hypothetical protein